MIYWQNSNGTFSVPYWLLTYGDGLTQSIYNQKILLDAMDDVQWEKIELKHSVRYQRPVLGTEVPSREA